MQGEDSFTFQLNKKPVATARSAESSLITLERAQKLDLLIHLIANLRQSLVISGVEGIGKSTLLNELKSRKQDVWLISTIQASSHLSFESIQKQILHALVQSFPEYKQQELSEIISSLDKNGQKVVVLIDDAGQLVPGVVSNVIQYAKGSVCLRIVFSLTHDELHLKSSSDSEINDCHFIEIPPLTEKQCGIFLQNLSGKQNATISFNAINERLIGRVYQQTHGIPGKIVAELPKMSNYKGASNYSSVAGIVIGVFIIGLGLSFFVFHEVDTQKIASEAKPIPVLKKIKIVEITPPVIYQKVIEEEIVDQNELKKIEQVLEPEDNVEILPLPEESAQQENLNQVDISQQKVELLVDTRVEVKKEIEEPLVQGGNVLSPVKKEIKKDLLVVKEVNLDDRLWLLSQSKNNYTIQLMVLSSSKSVDVFRKVNSGLKDQLRVFQPNKQNPKHVIVYGSFNNAVSATKQMKSLPNRYKKSWIRKMSDLQKGIKK